MKKPKQLQLELRRCRPLADNIAGLFSATEE